MKAIGKSREHVVQGLVKDRIFPLFSGLFLVEKIEGKRNIQNHPVDEALQFLIEKRGLCRSEKENAKNLSSPPNGKYAR